MGTYGYGNTVNIDHQSRRSQSGRNSLISSFFFFFFFNSVAKMEVSGSFVRRRCLGTLD